MSEKVLTLAEFAAAIRISMPTARKLCHSGAVKAGRAGTHFRIAESSVVEFLKSRGGSGSEGQTTR